MAVPTPGTPILRVIEGGISRGSRYRIGQNAGNLLPQAPINSTLQSLSPAQLAALGLTGVGVVGVGASAYRSVTQQPGDTVETGVIAEFGIYGEAGIEYRAFITSPGTEDVIPGSSNSTLFGPITPTISTGSNGTTQWWDFQGFDGMGNPLVRPGTQPVQANTWEASEPRNDFIVKPLSDLSGPALEPSTPPGQSETITIPEVPEFPVPQPAQDAEAQREQLLEDVAELGETVADVAAIAGALAETLAQNLPCDICNLVQENTVWDELNQQQLQDAVDDIQRRVTFELDAAVDVAGCEDDPENVVIQGDTLDALSLLLLSVAELQRKMQDFLCDELPKDCACPEEWTLRKNPATPVLVLRLRESSQGHTGTPKPRDISLPGYNGDGLSNFPSWVRGDHRCTVGGESGTRITVWAVSQSESRRVADELADLCSGFSERRYTIGFQEGIVVNKVQLTPFKTLWFPQGRLSGTLPGRTCNVETGVCFP